MKKTPLLVLLLAGPFLFAACAGAPRAPERSLYDLGSEPVAGRAVPPLRIELTLPVWLDNGEIAYRLLYDEPSRLRAYAGSRWAGRPGQLIAARLKERFATGSARCSVRIEIDEFAQHFARSDQSQQVLAARWTLRGANGEALLDDGKRFSAAAPSADARGGVTAAAQLVEQLAMAVAASAAPLVACRMP
jgi:cholesterol transport system auxiliary component